MNKTAQKAVELATAFEQKILPCGLTVIVHSMPGYKGVHAIYGTKFGSINRSFTLGDKRYDLPDGVAHFLEHKMFENEDGDAFSLYAKTGASANAYTSYDKTCYIFTANDHIDENLDILLSFVSKPYFTKETVEKEQGIIGQEIKMYDDSAEWRVMTSTFACLYHNHPVAADIAGSVESIAKITPEMLYACTEAFYRPQNMVLSVAGNITMDTVLAACGRANLPMVSSSTQCISHTEPLTVANARCEFAMPISKPMLCVGFKETPFGDAEYKKAVLYDILTDLICGSMTPLYRNLYDENLISPDFSGDFIHLDGASCFFFGGEVKDAELVHTLLLAEIARLRAEGVDSELFALCKNQTYGGLIQALESTDAAATNMTTSFFKGCTLAQEITAIGSLTVQDANEALQTLLCEERSATVVIQPAQ